MAKAGQEKVSVNLSQGKNELLLKIVNNDKKSGFYFAVRGVGFPEDILPVLLTDEAKRVKPQAEKISAHYRAFAKELEPVRKSIEAKRNQHKKVTDSIVTTPYMSELAKVKRRETYLMIKGSFLSKGNAVKAGFPASFHSPAKGTPHNRMGVARWLLQEDNPLTARVAVNRFGLGSLVEGCLTQRRILARKETYLIIPSCLTGWLSGFEARVGT